MSDALPLPPRPNLEQYKKLARDFQQACQSAEAGGIRCCAARWVETLALAHGADAWRDVQSRHGKPEEIERRWNRLKEDFPNVAGCTLAGAQFFVAREHGFTSWPKFARHVRELARHASPVSAFESAVDAIVQGDISALKRLLREHPRLVSDRSTREHRSTLLHYVSANGVEDYRQKTPKNIVEITRLLLDSGAEVDAESDAYGGGCTTLGLVATSIHPEQAGVQIELLELLLERGASLGLESAGNKHSIVHGCIANGQPGAAKYLAERGAPLDLESAATVGRLDVLESLCDRAAAAGDDNARKQMEAAFRYACGYGTVTAVQFLLERGVDVAAANDEGQTALHWACWGPEVESIKLLLDAGTPVDAKDKTYGATPLDTALWTWVNSSKQAARERCYEAVALLARAGAKLDPDQWRDANGESKMLDRIASDERMQAALKGEVKE